MLFRSRLERLPDCHFYPPDRIVGQSLDFVLPTGADGTLWQRLLNDCQIVAYQHSLKEGSPAAGGLWFWAAGGLPALDEVEPRVQRLFGTDVVWSALASWQNLKHEPETPTADNVPDSSLVAWEPEPGLDEGATLAVLESWMKPLWQRVRLGRLAVLEVASRSRVWRLTPQAAWQIWRRSPEPWA